MTRTPVRTRTTPAPTSTPTGAPPGRTRRRTGPYGELPRLAGAAFLPIAFVARLPFSMLTIGTLLLVSSTSTSIAVGGLAGAASALGTALGGPAQGALVDRAGQRRVLLVCAPVAVAAVLGLLVAATSGAPTALVLTAAAVTGASVPQVGPLARVRWIALTRGRPSALAAAMSYESTADEVSFVLGPALVGVLASTGSPRSAMLVAAACIAVLGTAFALHPTARAATPGDQERPAPRGGLKGLLRAEVVPLLGMIAMGVLFGGTQAAITAFTRDVGVPDAAGLVYAVMGVGSAATALAVVALPMGWSQRSRWVSFALGLLVCGSALVALSTLDSLGALVAGLAVTGLFVGPVMVTVFTVAGDVAPAGRTATAMTVVASANVVGVAVGASLGGWLGQNVSTPAAFALPAVASALLVVTGLSSRSRPPAGVARAGASPLA